MRRASLLALSTAAVLAGCDQPEVPLRLTPYEFRLAGTDSVFHWPATSLPVRIYVEPVGRIPDYAAQGLSAWQRQFLYGEFRGVVVSDSVQADVLLLLIGDPPPDTELTNDPPRLVCEGLTLVPPRGTDQAGQIRFTAQLRIELRWFPGNPATDVVNCLARVTTHEIGHALGIFAHSDDPFDLMYRQPEVGTPSPRDQATIQTLYHLPTDILPWDPNAIVTGAAAGGNGLP
ncbi:MAG: matrixin family metalloprotease [Gemmatimonadota bacterium]|nr:matrixin family metalloprotease [Gemmatimonadota bacterium]